MSKASIQEVSTPCVTLAHCNGGPASEHFSFRELLLNQTCSENTQTYQLTLFTGVKGTFMEEVMRGITFDI